MYKCPGYDSAVLYNIFHSIRDFPFSNTTQAFSLTVVSPLFTDGSPITFQPNGLQIYFDRCTSLLFIFWNKKRVLFLFLTNILAARLQKCGTGKDQD